MNEHVILLLTQGTAIIVATLSLRSIIYSILVPEFFTLRVHVLLVSLEKLFLCRKVFALCNLVHFKFLRMGQSQPHESILPAL